jgi:hypothetical protein
MVSRSVQLLVIMRMKVPSKRAGEKAQRVNVENLKVGRAKYIIVY